MTNILVAASTVSGAENVIIASRCGWVDPAERIAIYPSTVRMRNARGLRPSAVWDPKHKLLTKSEMAEAAEPFGDV